MYSTEYFVSDRLCSLYLKCLLQSRLRRSALTICLVGVHTLLEGKYHPLSKLLLETPVYHQCSLLIKNSNVSLDKVDIAPRDVFLANQFLILWYQVHRCSKPQFTTALPVVNVKTPTHASCVIAAVPTIPPPSLLWHSMYRFRSSPRDALFNSSVVLIKLPPLSPFADQL